MSLYYDSEDDAFPRSPGLAPVRVRLTPSPPPPPYVNLADELHGSSSRSGPNLHKLTIPQSRYLPIEELPALQHPQSPGWGGTTGSPNQERQLPSFRQISELETAIGEQEARGTNSYSQRQSKSPTGQSPASVTRRLSTTPHSPGNAFPPLSLTSPINASTYKTRDPFLRAEHRPLTLFSRDDPSQAPFFTMHSASPTNESHKSSDGLSPGTQPTTLKSRAHRIDIYGTISSRTLPPPPGSGGFKCEYPGCRAPPFPTQYLLNSHANVHTQTRPHFCPVAGCSRSEGGKGFKRKNEMIRHGLVHTSPGYVCPFCPDREHKYPRPDNLQRHVRVHHPDKGADDSLLREVLAQLPVKESRRRLRSMNPEPYFEAVKSEVTEPRSPAEPIQSQPNDSASNVKETDKTVPLPRSTSPIQHKDHEDSDLEKRLDTKARETLHTNNTASRTTPATTLMKEVWPIANKADPKAPTDSFANFDALSPNILPSNADDYQLQSLAIQPPATQGANQLVPVVPFSDSGYGTASHCSRRFTQRTSLDDAARADMTSSSSNHPENGQEPEYHSGQIDSEAEETATVYSDAMSLSDVRIDSYVSGLAEDIFRRLDLKVASDQIIERVSTALPELLKALALKFGFEAPSQMHRDVMFFIHKHRIAITNYFKDNFQTPESYPEFEQRPRGEKPSKEILSRWLGSSDDLRFEQYPAEKIDERDDPLDDANLEEDEELSISSLKEYRNFICRDPGYEWLLERLRRDMLLSRPEQDIMDNIGDEILRANCSTRTISRKTPSGGCKVIFCIEWDPFAFLDEQDFDDPDAQAIANAITLTGSCKDAQALGCREYLSQTWPSTGSCIIQLIQELLRSRDDGVRAVGKTLNGTTLSASLSQSDLVVEASGVPHFVAEIGEQLAWLGAALRTSPCPSGVVYSVPFIDGITPLTSENSDDGNKELQCSIKFRFEEYEDEFRNANGECWLALFRNPVIARGFPIPKRSEIETGLEIPLNMLAALMRTRYVDTFNSKVFMKGFSSMLVPTKRSDDMLIWHLLYNKRSSDRISYLDCSVKHVDVKLPDLEQARHIVGWCSEAVCNAGTLAASYSISRSKLPYTHSAYALEQAQISAGQFITGTAIFSISKKDKPVHISRFGYMTKIQWISSKYVNFWDEGEKRGWLVNGASALLHLLRASLEHSKCKFKSAFLLDPKDLPDADDQTNLESAMGMLIDEKHRNLKLYVDKTEVFDEEAKDEGGLRSHIESKRLTRYYLLEDRVEHIWRMLEKLMDHQTDIERRSGLQINPRPRRQLEGWDFRDLVTDGDPFFPRVASIQAVGKGWVDFTRAIHVVTLFGQGFGDLIQPKRMAVDHCSRWSSLPKGRYYLAACVSDLKEIMEREGDSAHNPMQLCDNVLWHTKHTTFRPCPCTGDSTSKHHDPVQALFPSKFRTMLRKKAQINLDDRGAVIFGHNANLHWHWRDNGDPVKGDPPQDAEDGTVLFNDSGLGSSLGSSLESSTSRSDSRSASSVSETLPSGQLATPASSDVNVPQTDDSESTGLDSAKSRSLKRSFQTIMSSVSKKRKF